MTAEIIPFEQPKTQKQEACAFCGRSKNEVGSLIGGPHGFAICNACVAKCRQLLGKTENTEPAHA